MFCINFPFFFIVILEVTFLIVQGRVWIFFLSFISFLHFIIFSVKMLHSYRVQHAYKYFHFSRLFSLIIGNTNSLHMIWWIFYILKIILSLVLRVFIIHQHWTFLNDYQELTQQMICYIETIFRIYFIYYVRDFHFYHEIFDYKVYEVNWFPLKNKLMLFGHVSEIKRRLSKSKIKLSSLLSFVGTQLSPLMRFFYPITVNDSHSSFIYLSKVEKEKRHG